MPGRGWLTVATMVVIVLGVPGCARDGGATAPPSLPPPGYGTARLILDPDIEPDPENDQLAVWIKEQACASGRAPIGREVIPVVVVDAERITITVIVEPLGGDVDCPDNPWHPIVVELDEPLGQRDVFDGSTVPPTRRTWPPSREILDQ